MCVSPCVGVVCICDSHASCEKCVDSSIKGPVRRRQLLLLLGWTEDRRGNRCLCPIISCVTKLPILVAPGAAMLLLLSLAIVGSVLAGPNSVFAQVNCDDPLPPPPATAAPCLTIVGTFTVKSDVDGDGPSDFPATSCGTTLQCPNDKSVFVTSLTGAVSGSQFRLTLQPILFQGLPATDPNVYNNAFAFPAGFGFATSEVIATFSPRSASRSGGFTLVFECRSSCPSTQVALVPTTIAWPLASPTPNTMDPRNSTAVVQSAYSTLAAQPAVCGWTITAPPCSDPSMFVSYYFDRRPVYLVEGITDPEWRLLFLQPTGTPYPVIFPDDCTAIEVFYPQAPSPTLQVRSSPSINVDFRVEYYCTYLRQCAAGATEPIALNLPGAAIVSDPDGEGPIPQRTVTSCGYDINCPYDTNVFMWHLGALFVAGEDLLRFIPCLGNTQNFTNEVNTRSDVQWGCNRLQLRYTAPPSRESPSNGFTMKYICATQCALGPPKRISAPQSLSLSPFWIANRSYSDMCRWEFEPICPDVDPPPSMVLVTFIRRPRLTTTTWKLILDTVYDEFRFVFPEMELVYGNTLFLPVAAYNISARVFGGNNATFNMTAECVNATECSAPDAANRNAFHPQAFTSTPPFGSGVLISDMDAVGPYPFSSSNCDIDISCPNEGDIVFTTQITGNFPTGTLTVGSLAPMLDTATNMQAVVGRSPVSITFTASQSGPGGWSIYYTCLSQSTTTATGTGTATTSTNTDTATTNTATTTSTFTWTAGPTPTATGTATGTVTPTTTTTRTSTGTATPTVTTTTPTASTTTTRTGTVTGTFTSTTMTATNTTVTATNTTTLTSTLQPPPPTAVNITVLCESLALCSATGTANASVIADGSAFSVANSSSPSQQRCVCHCRLGFNGSICDLCADGFAGPPGCDSCSNVSRGYPDCLDDVVLAAPPEASGRTGVIVGAALGGLIALLLLCCLIVVCLKRRGLAFRDVDLPFFRDPGRYTKGFAATGDEELIMQSAQRALNDGNGEADLGTMLQPTHKQRRVGAAGSLIKADDRPYDPLADDAVSLAVATKPHQAAPPLRPPPRGVDVEDI